MNTHNLTLTLLPHHYAVCKLPTDSPFPSWVNGSDFLSITKTPDELSIVCPQSVVPDDTLCETDWRIFKIEGQLDFSYIGILSEISTVLAQNSISIFAVSTYNTDYILVKEKAVNRAIKALLNSNYRVIDN